MKTGRDF